MGRHGIRRSTILLSLARDALFFGHFSLDPVATRSVVPPADVMYIEDAVAALVATLEAVSGPHTDVYVAHGRCDSG